MLSYNASQRKVYDVPGRTQSPYESKRLFAAVPVNQYSTDGSESFIYRSNMVWGNTSLSISQLQINFGNGTGLQTLTANTAININYADTGTYVWTIRATLSDNSVVQCYSDYFVLAVSSGAQRFLPTNITTPTWGTIPAVGGVHSGGTINIVYSSKQPTVPATLRKPLIIVENLDGYNIAPSLQREPFTMQTFLRLLDEPGSANDFNQQLDFDAGYDLVFIDFNNGTDGIVRNAAVVREAIRLVNLNKQFDNRSNRREQNVVMGIGTGGLHARYALASMAKSVPVVNSETRLLITHDAPHRGANIALGLQHLSRMLGNFSYFGTTSADIFPDYAETVSFLNTPINVETLLYRATSDIANNANTFMNTTYRTMVDFAPGTQPYQFVPTSLGNECARPLFTAGRKFIDFNQGVGVSIKVKLSIFGINTPSLPLHVFKYDCIVFASSIPTPSTSDRKVAELKTEFKYLLYGFIPILKLGYGKIANASNTYLPVDGVPGSFNTILGYNELRDYASAIGNWKFEPPAINIATVPITDAIKLKFYALVKAYQYNSGVFTTQYTALPVGSALDVDPFNSSTFTEKYVNGVNILYPSKGNTFIAQESNTALSLFNNASMRFTARNARFMFKEMEQLPNLENCSGECSNPFAISGNKTICGSNVFSIPGLQRGATVVWSANDPSFAIAQNTPVTNQATVTAAGNATSATLTATITGCGNTAAAVLPINQAYPYSTCSGGSGIVRTAAYPTLVPSNCTISVSLNLSPGASVVYTSLGTGPSNVPPTFWGYSTATGILSFQIPFGVNGVQSAFTISGNSCANGMISFYAYSSGGRVSFTAAPNPVQQTLIINASEIPATENGKAVALTASEKAALQFTLNVYDVNTNILLLTQRSSKGSMQQQLNVSKLKPS